MTVQYGSPKNTPVLWVNEYLKEKIAVDLGFGVPIFPSMPASIDDLTEQWVTVTPDGENERYSYAGVMGTWDRLFRRRQTPFPHIKSEQIIYYFYATESNVVDNMVQVQEEIFRLMDRGDETAEDINSWQLNSTISENPEIPGSNEYPPEFYFHEFKVYQLEEVRDIIDFGTARTYGGNKIIIEYKYHQMSPRTLKVKTGNDEETVITEGPLDNK